MKNFTTCIYVMGLIFLTGCTSKNDLEVQRLTKELQTTKEKLEKATNDQSKQISTALTKHSITWENEEVKVTSCEVVQNDMSLAKVKNMLILNSKSDAIEAVEVGLTSTFYSEDICTKEDTESCESFISHKVESFSHGILKKSKYSFVSEEETVCIQFIASYEAGTLDKDTPTNARKTYQEEEYQTTITNPTVLVSMATKLYMDGDYKRAIFYFSKAVSYGNSDAQNSLAYLYVVGIGVEKNYKEAARLYKLSVAQGNSEAQYNLGLMYKKGDGVQQNHKKAAELYKLSADQGDGIAQNDLGFMYERGQGVQQSYKEAARLYSLSADQGNARAQLNLGKLYEDGLGVQQSYKEAVRLYKLSADQGYADAQYNLGVMYFTGRYVQQNYQEAVRLFKLSAEQEDAEAQYNLGVIYFIGKGVQQNKLKAYKYLKKSVAHGSIKAPDVLEALCKYNPEVCEN